MANLRRRESGGPQATEISPVALTSPTRPRAAWSPTRPRWSSCGRLPPAPGSRSAVSPPRLPPGCSFPARPAADDLALTVSAVGRLAFRVVAQSPASTRRACRPTMS